jgi:hypothetical protein
LLRARHGIQINNFEWNFVLCKKKMRIILESKVFLVIARLFGMRDARDDIVLLDAPGSGHESPCTGIAGVEAQGDANDGGQGVLGMLPEDVSAAVLAHVPAPALWSLCSSASRPLQKMAHGFLSALTELDLSVQGIVQGNEDDMEGLAEILKSQCPSLISHTN